MQVSRLSSGSAATTSTRRSLDVPNVRRSLDVARGVRSRSSLDASAPRPPCAAPVAAFATRSAPRASVVASAAATSSGDWSNVGIGGFGSFLLKDGTPDYYTILGVDDDASPEEIKKAYRALAKECHPDFLGDEGHDICILLNQAYDVLSDPVQRESYNVKLEQALQDYEDDFTGQPLSRWIPTSNPKMAKNEDPAEERAVFVDEFSCIGCKNCIYWAAATFRIEPEHGRSRVFAQWLDNEERIQTAIDSCPVNCIHWVQKQDLPALEFVMQKKQTQRVNVGVMMAGQGAQLDVFEATATFIKNRKKREEELKYQARQRQWSPAQDAARRAAAQALRKKTMGVFAGLPNFEEMLQNAFAGAVSAAVAPEDFKKVGKRKRSVKWNDMERMQAEHGTIPLERSLVPVSVIASAYYDE